MRHCERKEDAKSRWFTDVLRRLLPKPIYYPLGASWIAFRSQMAMWHSPRWWHNVRKLEMLRDCHRGQRCFIVGNGPSLLNTPLHMLKDEFTFGLNRIYIKFPELGFTTTYLVCINDLVIRQCADDFACLSIPHFVSWRTRRYVRPTPLTHFINTDVSGMMFSDDIDRRVCEGYTVTYAAMQIAYYMGFTDVVLLGVDHSFQSQGVPNQEVVSEGPDPNHFDAKYFGAGFRWQLPDLEHSEIAYRMAKIAFERAGRRIRDGTVGGKLQVFEKVDIHSLLGLHGGSNA